MPSEQKTPWQLEEFRALRQEMDARAQRLYSLSALQLTISGAIFAFGITQHIPPLLLLIPFSSYLICGRYYDQHKGALRIARYVREKLDKDQTVILGWERWISQTRISDRGGRKKNRGISRSYDPALSIVSSNRCPSIAVGLSRNILEKVRPDRDCDYSNMGPRSIYNTSLLLSGQEASRRRQNLDDETYPIGH
jgi:hypothetical protein